MLDIFRFFLIYYGVFTIVRGECTESTMSIGSRVLLGNIYKSDSCNSIIEVRSSYKPHTIYFTLCVLPVDQSLIFRSKVKADGQG